MTDLGDRWKDVPNLPPTSPIRTMKPGDEPKSHQVQQRLAELGIDPDSAGAIIAAIFAKGWTFWLAGSPNSAFAANILEPRFGAPWAHCMGKTPAEALGCVFVICLDNPPWEEEADDLGWLEKKDE
jgi:hypothetical protein